MRAAEQAAGPVPIIMTVFLGLFTVDNPIRMVKADVVGEII